MLLLEAWGGYLGPVIIYAGGAPNRKWLGKQNFE